MDRYDKAILQQLQLDGRISNQELADKVGLSPSPAYAVSEPLKRAASLAAIAPTWMPKNWG